GDVFVIPEPLISDETAIIPGVDGQKMSKSYGNSIFIFEKEKELKNKIMKIVTDSIPVEDPKDPDKCNIFALYKLFAEKEKIEKLRERYLKGGVGYGEVKKELFGLIWEYFKPFREKREMLQGDIGEIKNILRIGAEKTAGIATKTLDDVKQRIGLNYY
ncbi:MAG: tryptophan--tRNA ligase, partial [Spirochaetota bacterium]|nr:tryptophan--tRNA ligase [Spirochaetota bacterium]